MSNSNTYRIIAFSLALLMFSTSIGFAVDMHYCGGHLKSVNFFGKARTCQELVKTGPTKSCLHPHHRQAAEEHNHGCSVDKEGCCRNKVIKFQSDQDQELQIVDYTLNKQLLQLVTAFVVTFFIHTHTERDIIPFAFYKPPLIPRDIPVLVQSFLL